MAIRIPVAGGKAWHVVFHVRPLVWRGLEHLERASDFGATRRPKTANYSGTVGALIIRIGFWGVFRIIINYSIMYSKPYSNY